MMMSYDGPTLQQVQGQWQPLQQPAAESVVTTTTLLVRHLPEAIPHETLSRLFSHYGASSVRPCSAAKMRNCAFVDFPNEGLASQALLQLNRLRFLGKVITVERANNASNGDKKRGEAMQPGNNKDSTSLPATNSSSSSDPKTKGVAEPIAPSLGIDYPFNPNLEYVYPPPDGNILTNIVNALIAVPRFYTQVLHLMNKMNIPAPFRMALPTPPLPTTIPAPPPPLPPGVAAKPPLADLSSDESELESSEEEDNDEGRNKNHSARVSSETKRNRKRSRRDAIIGPAVDKDVAHEAVGLKPASLVPKEIPMIKKKNTVLQIKLVPKPIQSESKDDSDFMNESGEQDQDDPGLKPYATTEDIESGKLPPEEILSLPMFKNYTAGDPATVLYIKNLAKDVVTDDFYFIFGSLFGSVEEAKSSLSVKLMQEGRMRGQAFVTFPSVDLAHRALLCSLISLQRYTKALSSLQSTNFLDSVVLPVDAFGGDGALAFARNLKNKSLVNGFVFKGKPMIIQFGRNPAASRGK